MRSKLGCSDFISLYYSVTHRLGSNTLGICTLSRLNTFLSICILKFDKSSIISNTAKYF